MHGFRILDIWTMNVQTVDPVPVIYCSFSFMTNDIARYSKVSCHDWIHPNDRMSCLNVRK